MIKSWRDIPGFFDFADIYDQAVLEAGHGSEFIEVGAFLGKSAAYMAKAILGSCKDIRFTVVDNWELDRESNWWERINNHPPIPWPVEEVFGMTRFDAFNHCTRDIEGREFINVLHEESVAAAATFRDQSLNFVFIDAEHRYPGISSDIKAWSPKVKPGGILAGHDYGMELWPDVKRAVDEVFPSVEHRGTSWLVRL